jgi:UDP-N-acetylglucosamine:LPS N-acetylglucosamine transferase
LNGNAKQNQNPVRIGLFFSDTGGGHRSATEALQAGILKVLAERFNHYNVDVRIDSIVENSHPLNRNFVQIYNYLLRHQQSAMKYYYWIIETFKPNDSKFGWMITKPYVVKTLHDMKANLVVSVHPMSNQYIARGLRESGLRDKTKLVTVVTDPNGDFWSGWACHESDLTIVPNDLAQQRLIELGVEPSKIAIMGMPVHPAFIEPPTCSAEEFRQSLGLEKDLPTICINSGWAGGGNMIAIYRALKGVKRKVQVVFLCGHNVKLYESLKKELHGSPIPTAVLPFHDSMADVMAACDLMVTKAGGLTSFEGVARRLPMAIDMITTPMPQEYGTARMLVEQGLAMAITRAEDIVEVVENMTCHRDLQAPPHSVNHQLDQVDAIFHISETLIGIAVGEIETSTFRSRLQPSRSPSAS